MKNSKSHKSIANVMKNAEVTQSMKYSQPFEKIIEQTKNNRKLNNRSLLSKFQKNKATKNTGGDLDCSTMSLT